MGILDPPVRPERFPEPFKRDQIAGLEGGRLLVHRHVGDISKGMVGSGVGYPLSPLGVSGKVVSGFVQVNGADHVADASHFWTFRLRVYRATTSADIAFKTTAVTLMRARRPIHFQETDLEASGVSLVRREEALVLFVAATGDPVALQGLAVGVVVEPL